MKSKSLLLVCAMLMAFHPVDAQRRNKKSDQPSIVVNDSLFPGLKWRNIGPFRGGRSVASAGVVGQPHTYYMGNYWRWHLENYGRWHYLEKHFRRIPENGDRW